jgi:hypothetical protein
VGGVFVKELTYPMSVKRVFPFGYSSFKKHLEIAPRPARAGSNIATGFSVTQGKVLFYWIASKSILSMQPTNTMISSLFKNVLVLFSSLKSCRVVQMSVGEDTVIPEETLCQDV